MGADVEAGTINAEALVAAARRRFHAGLLATQLRIAADGVPSIADRGSRPSREIAADLIGRLGAEAAGERLAGQVAGAEFETFVRRFLEEIIPNLAVLRCGRFEVRAGTLISQYEQYQHLAEIAAATRATPELKVAFGIDYLVKPDVVILRFPEPDESINALEYLVDESVARGTPIRAINNQTPILHASVSCKWTIRSDRAQNARSEALNLIRNRKGRLPHTAVVTAEPTPGRIASLAMGTGDIDCIYHIALPELKASVASCGFEDSLEMLNTMIDGRRLRDIGDLPFDLAV